MIKLTSIIVDDELHGRENLKALIQTYCSEVDVLETAETVSEAKELVIKYKPDVVFLDINMPVVDGFDFLEYFNDRKFMVVIISAHSDYGVRAVKTRVDDYLLKPVHIKDLQQTVQRLVALKKEKSGFIQNGESNKLKIPIAGGFELVDTNNIVRFEADGCYTKIILSEGKQIVVSKTLKEFEASVSQKNFYRVHKSHLINLNFIKNFSKFDGGFVTLQNGNVIEVSRRKLPEFIQTVKSRIDIPKE